jgi:hypothetical protein
MGDEIMHSSITKSVMAGCATILVSGCAMQQNAAPEYRLSSTVPTVVPGASMLQRGRAQLDAGLNALAIEAFRGEIRSNPDSADAYNGLAVAYGRIGRDDLARRYFETALAREPGNGKAHANLAKLTGNVSPPVEFAKADNPMVVMEPVSVTAAIPDDPIGELIDTIVAPSMASSFTITPSDENAVAPVHTLAKQGVLSTRFAMASARFTSIAAAANGDRSSAPDKPAEPPQLPEPTLPTGYPPVDYRAGGNRLVRVSLGEVHLVTRPEPQTKLAIRQGEFETFGDRLATWLPQSIAIEQAGSRNNVKDNAVLMAAIERAEQGKKLASAANTALPEMPEFAYLSFDTDEETGNV